MDLESTLIKMEEVPGFLTQFQTVVRMMMHPDLTGTPENVSVLMVMLPVGTATGLHNHKTSDEYEYIVSGTGVLEAGDRKDIPVEPFMMVYNPLGIMHEIRNTGNETMYLLRIHVPALIPEEAGDIIDKAIAEAKKREEHM